MAGSRTTPRVESCRRWGSPAPTRPTRHDQAADLSGLVLTASLLGQVLGVALLTGVYFGELSHGSAHALAHPTVALAGGRVAAATCAARMNRAIAGRATASPAEAASEARADEGTGPTASNSRPLPDNEARPAAVRSNGSDVPGTRFPRVAAAQSR
jgi:hypothetical protein